MSCLKYRDEKFAPYFRITAPPEYENMTTLKVLETLNWTDPALRSRYQEVILEESAHMSRYCVKSDGTTVLVRNHKETKPEPSITNSRDLSQ